MAFQFNAISRGWGHTQTDPCIESFTGWNKVTLALDIIKQHNFVNTLLRFIYFE